MTAAKNSESQMGGMVGASLMGKLNLPGVSSGSSSGGGYQPRMFGQRTGTDAATDGNQSDRSFASRFGTANAVSASVDISSNRFASGGLKSNLLGMSTNFGQPNHIVDPEDPKNVAMRQNFMSQPGGNPQSRGSMLEEADDMPNTGEKDP